VRNIVQGDSIRFEANLKDRNGTTITDAVGSLAVLDFGGSAVLGTNVTHDTDGTYYFTARSSGWAQGPITETWRFFTTGGTLTDVQKNNFRITGTDTPVTYIFANELKNYYENIEDYFDGDQEALVVDAFNEVNAKLESVGQKMPIKPKADGYYDQPLRDLNAYSAITRIVSKRQSGYNRGDDKPWFAYFGELAGSIYKKIENKTYNFDREYSVSEGGIGIGTKTSGTRPGQMETNWRGGIGTGFTDYTFERDWIVEVTGTGTAGEVNEGTYRWSNDGGLSYGTRVTGYGWDHLLDGVHVRFHRGTGTSGTNNIFAANDKWIWKTFPVNQTVGGNKVARSY
jgi:hypothetical protein